MRRPTRWCAFPIRAPLRSLNVGVAAAVALAEAARQLAERMIFDRAAPSGRRQILGGGEKHFAFALGRVEPDRLEIGKLLLETLAARRRSRTRARRRGSDGRAPRATIRRTRSSPSSPPTWASFGSAAYSGGKAAAAAAST